jgi:hypothetical protein
MTIVKYGLLSVALLAGLMAANPSLAASSSHNNRDDARLWVYVSVYDSNYDDNDFTIEVDGEDADPDSFRGDEDGTRVDLEEGRYEVEVRNDRGLRVTYSSGCEGRIDEGDTEHCYITLRDTDYNYYQPNYPNYYPTYSAPAVTIQKGYIPALPSTGFPPVSAASVAFAIVGLLALGIIATPYARKALTISSR